MLHVHVPSIPLFELSDFVVVISLKLCLRSEIARRWRLRLKQGNRAGNSAKIGKTGKYTEQTYIDKCKTPRFESADDSFPDFAFRLLSTFS